PLRLFIFTGFSARTQIYLRHFELHCGTHPCTKILEVLQATYLEVYPAVLGDAYSVYYLWVLCHIILLLSWMGIEGVKYVTVYAFSMDNFKKKPKEVQSLMELMREKIEELLQMKALSMNTVLNYILLETCSYWLNL
ncbi:hypothetical protein HN51_024558, partial [Arachis hypogaea]